MKHKDVKKNWVEVQKLQRFLMQAGTAFLFGIVGILIFAIIMIKIDYENIINFVISSPYMFLDFISFIVAFIVFALVVILLAFIVAGKKFNYKGW